MYFSYKWFTLHVNIYLLLQTKIYICHHFMGVISVSSVGAYTKMVHCVLRPKHVGGTL
jgi:hypothetical protein